MHDRLDASISDPAHGIEVVNKRSDRWTLAGDKHLEDSPETLRISKEAVAQSFRNLEQAAQTPDALTDDLLTQSVWDYTPQPTYAGAANMNTLIVEMLDLTGAPAIEAFAALTISSLPVAVVDLVKLELLRPKAGARRRPGTAHRPSTDLRPTTCRPGRGPHTAPDG